VGAHDFDPVGWYLGAVSVRWTLAGEGACVPGKTTSPMEYLDKLKQLTAWDAAPTLTEDELEELLASAALEDVNGLAPLNEEWTPTYDLNAAAAQGWLIKAARAAAIVDEPTAGVVTSRVFENCRAMAKVYAAKRRVTVATR
jgi:hypothetical protein